MEKYLDGRQIATRHGELWRDCRRVHVGVAQDSKFGPIYFIMYVNDIWNLRIKGTLIMYAVDAVLIYVAENETELLTEYDATWYEHYHRMDEQKSAISN